MREPSKHSEATVTTYRFVNLGFVVNLEETQHTSRLSGWHIVGWDLYNSFSNDCTAGKPKLLTAVDKNFLFPNYFQIVLAVLFCELRRKQLLVRFPLDFLLIFTYKLSALPVDEGKSAGLVLEKDCQRQMVQDVEVL